MRIEFRRMAMVAALSFAGTVLLVGGRSVDAEGETREPTLVVDGVALTVDSESYDGPPTARLLARNTTSEEARVHVRLRLMATRMGPPESRMGPMAEEAWSKEELLVLAPGEERTLEVAANDPLPGRSTGRFILSAGEQTVSTAQFRGKGGLGELVRLERSSFAASGGAQQGSVGKVGKVGKAGKGGKVGKAGKGGKVGKVGKVGKAGKGGKVGKAGKGGKVGKVGKGGKRAKVAKRARPAGKPGKAGNAYGAQEANLQREQANAMAQAAW